MAERGKYEDATVHDAIERVFEDRDNPWMTAQQIAKETGYSTAYVRRALREMGTRVKSAGGWARNPGRWTLDR